MSQQLPERPHWGQLKKQAKDLLQAVRTGRPEAIARAGVTSPAREFALHDAQRVIARDYGFASWAKLKAEVASRVTAEQPDPWLALAAAVKAGDAAAAEKLLARFPQLGAKLDDAVPDDAFGATPLLTAVYRGNRALIDVLLQAGADINARSHWWAGGFGVLDHNGGLEEFLIERGAVVDVHAASRLGRLARLRELVAGDPAVVHARGGDGKTPLHVAASIEVADLLLAHGADLDARDVDHESTAAQYLVRERPAVARHLVARGCRADILLLSALGDLARVRQQLDREPDCVRTTVSEACFPRINPHAGGTIYQWTLGWHKTPHSLAREFGHDAVFQLLMERTPEEWKLAIACELGDAALVQRLRASRHGAPAAVPAELVSKIAHAARNNQTAAVRLLLEAGWPVDTRGQHGGTLLHWAAFHGNLEMADELIRHGAPLEARDNDHDGTPVGWAVYGSEHGWHRATGNYAAVVERLLKAGAKPPESLGGTPQVQAVLRRFGVEGRDD